MVFTISYFLHLPARFPFLGEMQFDLILVALIAVTLIFSGGGIRQGVLANKFFIYFILFIVGTIPVVEWPGSVIGHGIENYIKVAVFFIYTIAIINTEKRLKIFIGVFLICQLFRVAEPVYLHITTGYWGDLAYSNKDGSMVGLNRLGGSPFDVVNSNQLAWVIVSTVPFIYYLAWQGGKAFKLVFIGISPILIYALMLTGSRSGMLSLVAVIIAIIILSEKKLKNIAIWGAIALPVFFIISAYLSADLKERYMSLFDPTAAGRETAVGRVEGNKKDLATIMNKPFVGHGLGTSKEVSANLLAGRAQIAHNMYIEALQEVGLLGFTIFMLFIVTIFKNLAEAKRKLKGCMYYRDSYLPRLMSAIQAWGIMDLFYSLSCFGINSWEWYLFGGVAATSLVLAREYAGQENSELPEQNDRVLMNPSGRQGA